MDKAVAEAEAAKRITKARAFEYRDGLIIALLALIPMRSRTLVALRIGKQLVKTGDLWALDIPAKDTKTRRALDYPISEELCGGSTCIWNDSDAKSPMLILIPASGLPINDGPSAIAIYGRAQTHQ